MFIGYCERVLYSRRDHIRSDIIYSVTFLLQSTTTAVVQSLGGFTDVEDQICETIFGVCVCMLEKTSQRRNCWLYFVDIFFMDTLGARPDTHGIIFEN